MSTPNRRQFLKLAAGAASTLLAGGQMAPQAAAAPQRKAQIAFVKTQDRAEGVTRALDLLAYDGARGKRLFVKPNFNSAHAAPGSTHNDTLSTLIRRLQAGGAERITVGDRSGMGVTRQVMEQKGIFRMGQELGFGTIVFDELAPGDWLPQTGAHWSRGFLMPRPVLDADGVIQLCCLKTHRYGGHFTLSLKNSVGLVAKYDPYNGYNYMDELHYHGAQREKIAEINAAYTPDLVVIDGVQAFVRGGPDVGATVNSEVVLAGTDRVALDAVGVAILRYFGTTPEVWQGRIFEQAQIARAVELGLGVNGPDQIELLTDDPDSAAYAAAIQDILAAYG